MDYVLSRYSFKNPPVSSDKPKHLVPGVSILRPLKGVDANLIDNLQSSLRLKYPKFEILVSVADADDPALEIAKVLIRDNPEVDVRLVIGTDAPCEGEDEKVENPKVNNLIKSYAAAKYEIVWILDSNISVTPDTLSRAVDCLISDQSIGLVHHIPIGINPESFGASVEQLFLNTFHAKVYTMINKLQMGSCVIGKSIMFRKSELNAVGGIKYFGKYMSEDNIIGQYILDQGRRHAIPGNVVYQQLGNCTLNDYFQRRMRWTRIRKFTVLAATIIEPFTECFLNGALGAFAVFMLFGVPWAPFYVGHVANWFFTDIALCLVVEKSMILDNFPRFLYAWIVRELTSLPCHIQACLGTQVEWRGKQFRLRSDGTVIRDPETDRVAFSKKKTSCRGLELAVGKSKDELTDRLSSPHERN
ncbi:hypothetical protein HDU83_007125 [Entophlyctis luteolus]|nr:hypothetical protein HDU83_007125 [Entophlyctis luteolus]